MPLPGDYHHDSSSPALLPIRVHFLGLRNPVIEAPATVAVQFGEPPVKVCLVRVLLVADVAVRPVDDVLVPARHTGRCHQLALGGAQTCDAIVCGTSVCNLPPGQLTQQTAGKTNNRSGMLVLVVWEAGSHHGGLSD